MTDATQTQGVFALLLLTAVTLMENEIARRGLQEEYVRALCPWYHSFEAASIDELWTLVTTPPARRIEVATRVLQEA